MEVVNEEKRRIHPKFAETTVSSSWQDPASGEFGLGFQIAEGSSVVMTDRRTVHLQITRKDAIGLAMAIMGWEQRREDVSPKHREAAATFWKRD